MTFLPFWVWNLLASCVFLYLNYKNADQLSPEQKEERNRVLRDENSITRWQNWSFLLVLAILVLLNLSGFMAIPMLWFHILIIFQSVYTIFRNRSLYLKIGLPGSFINREFVLRFCSVAVLAFFVFYVF